MQAIPRGWDMGIQSTQIQKLTDIVIPDRFTNRLSFGVPVLDSIINGDGLIKGQLISVAAAKGSGKTTLLMSMLDNLHKHHDVQTAYLSNEECIEQLAYTAKRLNLTNVNAGCVKDIDMLAHMMSELDVMVIDSVAGLQCNHIQSPSLREEYALNTLCQAAQKNSCAVFFIRHYTKTGIDKGNSAWGHAVDTCINLKKIDDTVRLIEVEKNRFGSGTEIHLRMTATGFDYDHPVTEETPEKPKSSYSSRKADDYADILITIESCDNEGAKLADFADLGIDMGRVERLLKELTISGKIHLTGGGKGKTVDSKRWTLA